MVYDLQSIKTLIFLIDWSPNKGSFLFINLLYFKRRKKQWQKRKQVESLTLDRW